MAEEQPASIADAQPVTPNEEQQSSPTTSDADMLKDYSYFFGYSFGENLRKVGIDEIDNQELLQGLADSLAVRAPRLDADQQNAVIREIHKRQEQQDAMSQSEADAADADNMEQAVSFLIENGAKPNINTTDSGLQYEVLVAGTGSSPLASDEVSVNYEGTFINGEVFDSSIQRGETAEFRLNQVIAGWTEGLQLMKVGGKTRFFIRPELAYGPGGRPGIPPNSLLIFEVELLSVNP